MTIVIRYEEPITVIDVTNFVPDDVEPLVRSVDDELPHCAGVALAFEDITEDDDWRIGALCTLAERLSRVMTSVNLVIPMIALRQRLARGLLAGLDVQESVEAAKIALA